MLKLKQSAAVVLMLSSSITFAGTMGPACVPGDVTVPCEQSAWDVGIHALYVQPGFNDRGGNYLGEFIVPAGTSITNTYVENDMQWGWGFSLEGSYHFSTGNDLTVSWYHADDHERTQSLPVNFISFLGLTNTNDEYATTKPRWDAVNVEFGQHVDLGSRTNLRFHGGLQYAELKYHLQVRGINNNGTSLTYSDTSKSSVVGPRVGVDTSYDLGKGWGVYANGATALLVGKGKVNQSQTTNINQVANFYTSGSRDVVVPEMEAKLGVSYVYPMAQGRLIVDGGYMWVNYFNSNTTATLDDSDFAIQGPYFGLKWVGTLA